jgi:hypothetical protein
MDYITSAIACLNTSSNKSPCKPSTAPRGQQAQRLQTATTEQLELWADRILDAPTLAAVFDGH